MKVEQIPVTGREAKKQLSPPMRALSEFYDYTYYEAGEIFYVVGRERGEYSARQGALNMAIRTTRVFRRIDGEWRQVHHHGSIDDPELLGAYQKAVSSNA